MGPDQNMLVAETVIRSLVSIYGKHTIYTDGGTRYLQAGDFLHLKHRLYPCFEKSLIERVIQYFRNNIESFDEYCPCIKYKSRNNCDPQHINNWIELFVYLYNTRIRNTILKGCEIRLS